MISPVGYWCTDEGAPYTRIVPLYGRLVSSNSDEFKDACEARSILGMPLEARAGEIRARATKRGAKDPVRVARIRAAIESWVLAEWKWRKAQREAPAAQAGAA